jgi:hypothetical protein
VLRKGNESNGDEDRAGHYAATGAAIRPNGAPLPVSRERANYFRCFPTSFVISNMFTADLPPKTAFSVASALIMRLFLGS